jgi:hypothetical protein
MPIKIANGPSPKKAAVPVKPPAAKRAVKVATPQAEAPAPIVKGADKFKTPRTLAAAADRYYELREKRLSLQKAVDLVEEEEKFVKEHLIQHLPKSEASGIAGKLVRVAVVKKMVPQVQDWDKFYAHIKKTNSFELLQRRVADTAVKERWDNGKQVPGVGHFDAITLSMNKL